MTFHPLHNHSYFSLLKGVPSVEELVAHAVQLGVTSLGLTDINSTSGLILFIEECRSYGIKPVMGVELRNLENPSESVVLLAKNSEGYQDLCELTTMHLKEEHRGRSMAMLFKDPRPNLWVWCNTPPLFEQLIDSPIKPQLLGMLIAQDFELRQRSRAIEALAFTHSIPLMASHNCYFLEPSDFEVHRVLAAINHNTTTSRLNNSQHHSPHAWFKKPENIAALFSRLPSAVTTTQTVADSVTDDLQKQPWILPKIEVPYGYTPESYLRELASIGLDENYPSEPTRSQAQAIQLKELDTICTLGYASYFLMVHQIRDWANNHYEEFYRKAKECTIMRGSAANCMTFYNLGASDLDPLRYNLYFERFLNEDRGAPPDADLDFGWDERDAVLNYFFDTWGEDHVAMMCTTNHFRWNSAFREVAKVYGYSEEQVTEVMSHFSLRHSRYFDSEKPSTRLAVHTLEEISDPTLKKVITLAHAIVGRPHFLSQHCGGVIVTNEPIWRHVACQKSGGTKNRTIIQIDMHNGTDYLGLIKFDILGNGSLSVLRDTLRQLENQNIPDPEVWDIEKCYADKKVQAMIRSGFTRGIFYLESPAQSRLNIKSQAETFEEIGITSSLIRPAGTAYCDAFVTRHREHKAGKKTWEFLHPALEGLLGETHDICVFQEDIIKICVEIAGFSFKKADYVRKTMNSNHEGVVENYHLVGEAFIKGCMALHGFTQTQGETLWKRINSFTGFSFCKSHSLSYAQLSYRCSYLKAYYPAQFIASVISNKHGFYSYTAYLDEARRLGIEILPVDINKSEFHYYGIDNTIRTGFMHIKDIRQESIHIMLSERICNGSFQSFEDFLARTPQLGTTQIEALIMVGALAPIAPSQPYCMALLHQRSAVSAGATDQLALPLETACSSKTNPAIPLQPYSYSTKCLYELYYLGFMTSGNIHQMLQDHPAAVGAVSAVDLCQWVGKKIHVIGTPITRRSHRVAASGDLMMFLTLQDHSGTIDVVVWPQKAKEYSDRLQITSPIRVDGVVQEDNGTFTLQLTHIALLDWHPAQVHLFSKRSKRSNTAEDLSRFIPETPQHHRRATG
ncbi:MAG: DNA polymerase III subunit alpha [Fibrobacterales bacterium]